MTINEKIKQVREATGLGIVDAADRAGLTTYTLRALESGAFEPRMGQLDKLATAYGVSFAELLHPNSWSRTR